MHCRVFVPGHPRPVHPWHSARGTYATVLGLRAPYVARCSLVSLDALCFAYPYWIPLPWQPCFHACCFVSCFSLSAVLLLVFPVLPCSLPLSLPTECTICFPSFALSLHTFNTTSQLIKHQYFVIFSFCSVFSSFNCVRWFASVLNCLLSLPQQLQSKIEALSQVENSVDDKVNKALLGEKVDYFNIL